MDDRIGSQVAFIKLMITVQRLEWIASNSPECWRDCHRDIHKRVMQHSYIFTYLSFIAGALPFAKLDWVGWGICK